MPRQYWAFLSNPDHYRIFDAVRELEFDSWWTKGRDVHIGDRAIIWKGKGSRDKTGRRGIIALAEIVDEPEVRLDNYGLQYVTPPYTPEELAQHQPETRVTLRYLHAPNLPLWLDGPSHDLLAGLSVSRGQGTVFHVTEEQWHDVLAAVGGWPEAPEIVSVRQAIEQQTGKGVRGQGFTTDSSMRQFIEHYAMERAIAYFEGQGWQVDDVSATQSYDLRCARAGQELHVEVKGTTSAGAQVIVTANEVAHAKACFPNVALFVVSHIVVKGKHVGSLTVDGGETMLIHPWHINDNQLHPIGFVFDVPAAHTADDSLVHTLRQANR